MQSNLKALDVKWDDEARASQTIVDKIGYALALAATAIWAGNFVVARGIHEAIPPAALAFWRWAVATVALAPFALRPTIAAWPVIRRHWRYLTVTALVGVTLFNTLIYVAGHTTEAINLSLIAASSPVFVILLARFLYGDLITPPKAIGTVVALGGVTLLITAGSLDRLLRLTFAIGDLWMLLAALAFAGYSTLVKHKPEAMDTRVFLMSTFTLGVLFLIPLYWGERRLGYVIHLTPVTTLAVLYVGIGASLVAFFAWNEAIVRIGPSRAALMYYLVPVFSGVASSLILGEPVGVVHVLSMALIVSGIAVATRAGASQRACASGG
ncbi:MAG TPA: DMT family transporter [Chloroflexi bacterium]|nr:DMT family transporter [Chloroflexota bacterium]